MTNEKGFSWPETILSLSILLLVATTLLPMTMQITYTLENKKRHYHASLVMHDAVKRYIDLGEFEGTTTIEDLIYQYNITSNGVCVIFEGVQKEEVKCIEIT